MKKDRYFLPLTILCTMAYFVSYLTRINYQALISEIVVAEGITKSLASLAVTGLFITYGVGQLISGVLGDRMDPRLLVFLGLGSSSVINLLMPLFSHPTAMTVLWTVNGFSQALIWPPLVKIMSANLSEEKYEKAAFWVSCGSATATVLVYFLAPACITLAGWRFVFYICSGLGIGGSLVWLIWTMKMKLNVPEKKAANTPAPSSPSKQVKLWDIIPLLLISLAIQGLLRDGISTWTPSYLSETFELDTAISILISVVLPICSIFAYRICSLILKKCKGNEILCAMLLFGAFVVTSLCLYLFGNVHPILSALLLMLCSGVTHAINYVLICIAPRRFSQGNVSSMSGLLNFSVYVGSALSTFGFAELSTNLGWGITILCWVLVAVIGGLLCASIMKKWKQRLMTGLHTEL